MADVALDCVCVHNGATFARHSESSLRKVGVSPDGLEEIATHLDSRKSTIMSQ